MSTLPQLKHAKRLSLGRSRAVEEVLAGVPLAEVDLIFADPHTMVSFRCNICGSPNTVRFEQLGREVPSCKSCASTVRFRAIVDLLIGTLIGQDLRLDELPNRKDVVGLGLSDADAYAVPFTKKFNYTNTYYHIDPHLDIANVPQALAGKYDFIIASDVFEHVVPPVSKAFRNARRLLKPGGFVIFTVPFGLEGGTVEHFPELHDFTVANERGRWVLHNCTADGRRQTYTDLVFHGGPGSTLEMRVFSLDSIKQEFLKAGFKSVEVANRPCAEHGVYWPDMWSVPIIARM